MAHAAPDKYLRNALVSGNVRNLASAAGAAAIDTSIARYTTGGTSSGRRWRPITVTTTSVNPPSVGTAPADDGWRVFVGGGWDPINATTVLSGTWTVRGRYKRTGSPVGEVDQSARITVILYRVTSAGVFVSEIARGSVDVTFTTTAQTATISIPSVAAQNFDAGDLVQLEAYCETLALGIPAAPLTNEDLVLRIGESEASGGSKVSVPNYTIRFARSAEATAVGVPTADRLVRAHRPASAVAVGIATVSNVALRHRLATAVAVGVTARALRKVGRSRSATASAVATVLPKKVGIRRAATAQGLVELLSKRVAKRFSAQGVGVATFSRRITNRRFGSATAVGVVRAWIKLPADKIPGGGIVQVIKRFINLGDD